MHEINTTCLLPYSQISVQSELKGMKIGKPQNVQDTAFNENNKKKQSTSTLMIYTSFNLIKTSEWFCEKKYFLTLSMLSTHTFTKNYGFNNVQVQGKNYPIDLVHNNYCHLYICFLGMME